MVTPKATVTPKEVPAVTPKEAPRFEPREVVIPPKKSLETWLAEIEALRKAGKHAEADAELAKFRQRYPDYPSASSRNNRLDAAFRRFYSSIISLNPSG